jgi:hypothetical protein
LNPEEEEEEEEEEEDLWDSLATFYGTNSMQVSHEHHSSLILGSPTCREHAWMCTMNFLTSTYSLRPKMIVLLLGFFCPKMIVQFICLTRNLRLKIKYFCPELSISRNILEHKPPGCFRIVIFNYFKSHTYNYSVNAHHALILPKLKTF